MAVRNVKPHDIELWRGLNSFINRTNIDEQSWIESDNVLVNARGEAEALRSPKAFGESLIIDDSCCASDPSDPCSEEEANVLSMDEYQRTAGNVLVIDKGEKSYYIPEAGGVPVQIKVGNDEFAPWTSLSINDTMQRVNGVEFVQFMNDLTSVYRNGIDPPAGAPILSYVANASDSTVVATSLFGSYAYMNSTTGHVSAPSPLSNTLAAKAAGFSVQYTVQPSVQPGVDKIVFFLTVDGGNIPYLVLDCSCSCPHTIANGGVVATITQNDIVRDTLTPEPLYNDIPPVNADFMFSHKDRIFLVVDGGMRYSGFESCYIGNPYECWPELNQLNVPNRNDKAVGGISTQSGALIFGEKDCYLMTGYPSDKVSSPNNTIAVTEHIDQLDWNIGITYPKTAVKTPFGVIWTDQTRRIRLWNQQGFPSEIAQNLRTELDEMTGTMTARWFQHGKNGGYYVLTDGTKTLFIMVYMSTQSGQMQFGYGKSTYIQPDCMANVTFSNVEHFYYAQDEQVWEILDPDLQGDGWAEGTEIFFKMVIGADNNTKYTSLHSMYCDGNLEDLEISHSRMDESDVELVDMSSDQEADTGGSVYGLADSEERRYHIIKFEWGIDDRAFRNIHGFVVNVRKSNRVI